MGCSSSKAVDAPVHATVLNDAGLHSEVQCGNEAPTIVPDRCVTSDGTHVHSGPTPQTPETSALESSTAVVLTVPASQDASVGSGMEPSQLESPLDDTTMIVLAESAPEKEGLGSDVATVSVGDSSPGTTASNLPSDALTMTQFVSQVVNGEVAPHEWPQLDLLAARGLPTVEELRGSDGAALARCARLECSTLGKMDFAMLAHGRLVLLEQRQLDAGASAPGGLDPASEIEGQLKPDELVWRDRVMRLAKLVEPMLEQLASNDGWKCSGPPTGPHQSQVFARGHEGRLDIKVMLSPCVADFVSDVSIPLQARSAADLGPQLRLWGSSMSIFCR